MLDNYLIQQYELPTDHHCITPIDNLNMIYNFKQYQLNLIKFMENNKDKINNVEKSILMIETHKYRYLMELISQSHISNYLFDVYLVLSDNKKLERLYKQKHQIINVANYIIKLFDRLINKNFDYSYDFDLITFYNEEMINKFIDILNYEKPNSTDNKVLEIYNNYLLPAIFKVQNYLTSKLIKNVFNKTSSFLSQFDPHLYMFYLNYYTGLDIINIDELHKWAYKQLYKNRSEKEKILKKLYKTQYRDDLNNNNNLIINDAKYNFNSEEEYIEYYRKGVEKGKEFIKRYNIPHKNDCILKVFSNKDSPGAYYSDNCFYLNTFNWKKSKKYEVAALTFHESYPGHHVQIDISNNFSKNKYITTLYSNNFTGFIEGWALFAEQLGELYLEDTFGMLDSDTLRILRIIVDIDIHYYNKTIAETVQLMKKYLALDENYIISEVNRYCIFPGQAVSYKMGQAVFMNIYNRYSKNGIKYKINDPYMFKIYIKILLNGSTSLNNLI